VSAHESAYQTKKTPPKNQPEEDLVDFFPPVRDKEHSCPHRVNTHGTDPVLPDLLLISQDQT